MIELWNRHMVPFGVQYHPIQQHKFSNDAFLSSIEERVNTLERCENILVDAYWAIKMVAIAFFTDIPPQLPRVAAPFQEPGDAGAFTLKIAEKFVNSLLVFFTTERDILTPELLVYGKINTFLRVKRTMNREDIVTTMVRNGVSMDSNQVHGVMERLQDLGLVSIDPGDPSRYLHAKRLELSPEQEAFVQKECFPLVDWAIETWRTMFNIRELNTPVPDAYPEKQLVEHVVSHAATQGFTNAHFCFVQLKEYFQRVQGNC